MRFVILFPSLARLFAGIAFGAVLLLFWGCQTPSRTVAGEEGSAGSDALRVGVTANMPPFVFEEDGKLVGLEVDFAIALASELDRKVRFVRMDWEDLIPALRRNKIDIIMSGMNYNPERAAIVAFAEPYLRSGQMAMVLQKNVSKFPVPGFVFTTKGKVGAEEGTTGAYLVQSSFPKATAKTYSSARQGAQAVLKEEIELFVHDAPTAFWMAGLYQSRGLTVSPAVLSEDLMSWAVSRENLALLDAVNTVLEKWTSSGAIDAILGRWVQL